jgi:phosphatidylinositol-3-phosphatase
VGRGALREEAPRGTPLTRILFALVALALAGPAAGARAIPHLAHVVVVVFENHESTDVLGAPDAPTFNALADRYATIDHYDAVAHPSLPNYLALVSGSTQGITDDCTDCTAPGRSIADTLEQAGKTWKTYAEGLPTPGFTGASAGRYAKKHDPFLYFPSIASSPQRRAHVVPFPQLATDVRTGRLPAFSLVVPDLCNDMHDCSVATGDAWLKRNIAPLASLPRTVIFVVVDEGTSSRGGGGHVAALAVGPDVRPGTHFSAPTTHYGLLRTIETALQVPLLGASRTATPITRIWR